MHNTGIIITADGTIMAARPGLFFSTLEDDDDSPLLSTETKGATVLIELYNNLL